MKTLTLSTWQVLDALADTIRREQLRVMLWSTQPGTGKSSWAIRQWGNECERTTLHQRIEPFDLLYEISLQDGKTVRHDGPVIRAMRNGKPLILDEFDAHSPAVRCLLQQVCDDPEICQVTLPDGEVVKPASGFCVVATSNLDPSKLHPALADRFDIRLNTYSPNAEVFAAFPEGIANQLRNLYGTATETTRELSLRAALSFKRLTAVGIDPELAARAVFGTAGLEWLQLASI